MRNKIKDKRVFVLRVITGTIPTKRFYSKKADRFITKDFAQKFHTRIKTWRTLHHLEISMDSGLREKLNGTPYKVVETISNLFS